MSRLVKPIVYAKEQNISRQAVYAKIKKGLLKSKTVEGKIYIILNEEETQKTASPSNHPVAETTHLVEAKELLASKDETISVLKESIKDLKHTNTEINTTLRGEIELLKQVFTEMRNLYVKQVDYMGEQKILKLNNHPEAKLTETTEIDINENSDCWVDLETFFERANIIKNKKREKVKKRLLKAYEERDKRIKKEKGILFMSCYDFYEDILKKT